MTRPLKSTSILAGVDYPLYSVQLLTGRHVLVAGGGGFSNTGVANGFECFELTYENGSVSAKKILKYDTGNNVVMNCAAIKNGKNSYIAAGQEKHCQLYKVKYCVTSEKEEIHSSKNDKENSQETLRNRKNVSAVGNNHSINDVSCNKSMTFQFLPEISVQTEFHGEDSVQNVVKVNLKDSLIITGGTNGHIRIWQFPSMKLKLDIDAHKKEIDDIDIDPNSSKIVSVSKDETAVIWDSSTGEKIHELKWVPSNGMKYLFKRSRFSVLDSDPKISCLFMLTNAIGKKIGKNPAQVQLWHPGKGFLVKHIEFKQTLSALAVRNDGRFVAAGTLAGTVFILTSFNLKVVMSIPNAHSFFITGLEFVPVSRSDNDDSFTTTSEASVISISVDKKVCIHNLSYRDTIPIWIALLFLFFVIFASFTLCNYIGL